MTTSAAEERLCECARYSYLVSARIDEIGSLTWDGEPVRTTCGGAQTKSTFAPGHDGKLSKFLIEAGAQGALVRDDSGAVTDAVGVARRFGFGSQVASGIAKRLST